MEVDCMAGLLVRRGLLGFSMISAAFACGPPTAPSVTGPKPEVGLSATPPRDRAPKPTPTAATVKPRPTATASAPAPPAPQRATIQPLASSRFLGNQDLALFNQVCQLRETKDGVGCACCPGDAANVSCAGGAEPSAYVEHVYRGAFSATGVEEAYATGLSFDCGNLGAWGANWFLRRDGDQWKTVKTAVYAHHVLNASVWKLANGRIGLVTHDVISKSQRHAIAFTTFGADGTPTREELVSWSNASCHRRVPGFYQAVAMYKGANAFDQNKDGKKDLVVTVEVRRLFADKRFESTCATSFGPGGVSPFDTVAAKKHVIPLLFDGASFRVEPRAQARFAKAHAEVDKAGNPFVP